MSGGSHDHAHHKLNEIADSFDVPEVEYQEERKKVAEILRRMSEICHDIEWIDSSDYGPEDWEKVIEMLNKIKLT